ncbi:hypothetical protein C0J45_14007 [Silurus meridionalis]|nr:hypothetical protein C0J45_14007 [Silurus meridionalis]
MESTGVGEVFKTITAMMKQTLMRSPKPGRNGEGYVRKGIQRKTCAKSNMRITDKNFIPNRSRPGLTTTATGIVSRQGTGGNWATVKEERRRRGGRRLQRQQEKEKCRRVEVWVGTLNVGTMTVGCEMKEKERFWSELDEVVDGVPRKERLVIGADFDGHVGEGNRGDEEVIGRYGLKERNVEGQMVVDFAKRMEMAVVNTYFKKKEDHRVTYKSGGRCTQVDYVLCRRCNLKEIEDCKVLAGDSVARQHRMVCVSRCLCVYQKQKWDRQSDEKSRQEYKEMQQQKAYDSVPREELWYCMRKGSALSPFLFAVVMDRLTDEVRQESPWTMMFADDIVICVESSEQVEKSLERWRYALERMGMKVSRSKTEYMCVNERKGSGVVRLQGEEVEKMEEFRYLGLTVQSNGECVREVKKRVQAGWGGWRRVTGVICDRRVSVRMKGNAYRTVVRPVLYGLETVALNKRQEAELEVAELKMLRFSLGVTRMDRIRNEFIRVTAHVGCFLDKDLCFDLKAFGTLEDEVYTRLYLYSAYY